MVEKLIMNQMVIYLTGESDSRNAENSFDEFLKKLDTNGTEIWTEYYEDNFYEGGGRSIISDDGSVILLVLKEVP